MNPTFEVIHGNCLDAMRAMPDESVHAIITDPPYGLSAGPSKYLGDEGSKRGYFGKEWDHGVPGPEYWTEVLRVAKPGAQLLAFGGSRTFHRLAVAIEDSGWNYLDTITYLYSSGMPKSLDIGKAIDASDRIGFSRDRALKFTAFMREVGMTAKELNAATNSFMGNHFLTDKEQPQVATEEMFAVLRPMIQARGFKIPDEIEEFVRARTVESENMKRRKVTGTRLMADFKSSRPVAAAAQGLGKIDRREVELTEAHTEDAKKWEGWGTMSKCYNCGRDHDDPWDGPKMGFPDWDDDCGAKPYVEPPPINPADYGRRVRVTFEPDPMPAALGGAMAQLLNRIMLDALRTQAPPAMIVKAVGNGQSRAAEDAE